MHFYNKNIYFILFISISLIITFTTKSLFSILFVAIAIFCSFSKRKFKNKKNILFLFIILLFFVLYWIIQIIYEFDVFDFILKNSKVTKLREWSINYIESSYARNGVKSLLLLMLFNEKTKLGWQIYNQLKLISVCHIIVISGFHLNLLITLINKIFRNKYINFTLNFFILFTISIFLDFSIGVIRVFLIYVISIIDRKKNLNNFEKLILSAIIILFFKPRTLFSYSFQMSYLATFSILYINKIYKKKFLKDLLINFTINIYLYPIISKMNKCFSLWSFIYSFLFSWIYLFNFILFLFFYIPGIEDLYLVNYFITEFSIKVFIQLNIVINRRDIDNFLVVIYYLVIFYFSWIIYKFKKT